MKTRSYFLSTVVSISYDGGLTSIDTHESLRRTGSAGFDRFRDKPDPGPG